jgi:hypothetical protein
MVVVVLEVVGIQVVGCFLLLPSWWRETDVFFCCVGKRDVCATC